MEPLKDGTANVIEFTKEGQSTLHPFNCITEPFDQPKSSTFIMTKDEYFLFLNLGKRFEQSFKLLIKEDTIELTQASISGLKNYTLTRTEEIKPICSKTKELDEQLGHTAFEKSEFIENPWIPDHDNIERYAGQWKTKTGETKIEIVLSDNGQYKVEKLFDHDLYDLYNNIRWLGDELYIEKFIYTDQPKMFGEFFHKMQYTIALIPTNDPNQIEYITIIDNRETSKILTKK